MEILNQCGEKYPSPECCEVRPATILESLQGQKRNLEQRLAKINAGIEVLEKDPKLAEQLETLTKAVRA